MTVDIRGTRTKMNVTSIFREEGEVATGWLLYLGVHLDNRLDWTDSPEAVYREGQRRLYFFRKLRSFNVCSKTLHLLYQSVAASAIIFAGICWGISIRVDTKELNKLMKKAGSVLGTALEPIELVVERRMLHKLLNIMDNTSHPLHDLLVRQQNFYI